MKNTLKIINNKKQKGSKFLMYFLGLLTPIFGFILYVFSKKNNTQSIDNIKPEIPPNQSGIVDQLPSSKPENTSLLIEAILAFVLLAMAVVLGFSTTSNSGYFSESKDRFYWNITPQNGLEYAVTLNMNVLPNSNDIEVTVETDIPNSNYWDTDYDEKAEPYRTGEQKVLMINWPENVEYKGDVEKVTSTLSSGGYQMKAMQHAFPDISFLWVNGVKRINFSERMVFLRFGNIITSDFDAIEALGLPFEREKFTVNINLPIYYKIVSEQPPSNQNILITKTYFEENQAYRQYVIEVGHGGTSEFAVHANSDLELVLEDTRLSKLRDMLIMLVGILFGVSSNLITNIIISVYNRRLGKTKAG